MKTPTTYISSKLITGEMEVLRHHSFTRWMSRDLMQAAVDFNRNIGLLPIYCESSTEHLTRYLFWRVPTGAVVEVRSGRNKNQFEEFDRANRDKGWRLLSLHISEGEAYSAVWITADHFQTGKAFLAAQGITVAERVEG